MRRSGWTRGCKFDASQQAIIFRANITRQKGVLCSLPPMRANAVHPRLAGIVMVYRRVRLVTRQGELA